MGDFALLLQSHLKERKLHVFCARGGGAQAALVLREQHAGVGPRAL